MSLRPKPHPTTAPIQRQPHVCTFTLPRYTISVPDAFSSRLYVVTFEGLCYGKCTCEAFKQTGACNPNNNHVRVANDYAYTEAGMWEIYELLEAQIPAVKPSPDDLSIYTYNGLVNLKDEIGQRLGLNSHNDEFEMWEELEPAAPPCVPYNSGAPLVMGEYDDSDPFADEVVTAPVVRPVALHPLAISLLLESGVVFQGVAH